ncbi:DNA repair protein RecN [Gordonia sp. (in: high G+C Gram-positive bacteria)]|uniref:DNA repair protein RecN n=1 Tax=Gordonia sp. (in: high G+C Gram-positive bacteria) TaxID=84139 RepID=UPI0016BC9F81|nr:DNA repair protein RecN [Gordonia sp. (in: high G+C Gram-positive bacteria)]NLG48092.1 DNA repair protein RecN [Gordonia sp. (in: high G+C Gram-positive bacteria)]
MLEELSIRSLGVLDSASAQFHPGFTALTGETGAGKTMIVTSLRLLSGGRADAGRVRTGDPKAIVEGRFRLPEDRSAVAAVLEEVGADIDDDDTLIAARTVNADGRSRAHLGGRSVPVGTLAQLTGELLAIHGQNDQLRLIRPEQQRAALDRYAGATAASTLTKYRAARAEWVALLDELDRLRANSRDIALEADRLRFGVDEIDAVAPEPGEDADLIATIRRMTDLEDIRRTAVTAQDIVAGSEGMSVVDGLGTVRSLLESASDEALRGLQPRVEEALTVVADLGSELTAYLGGLPEDAGDLDSLLNRQAELKSLTRKYAADIDGVLAWRDQAQHRLSQIEDPEGAVEELEARSVTARDKVAELATKLHAQRTKYAKGLATKVSAELTGLAMGGSAMSVTVTLLPADDDRLAVEIDGHRAHAGGDGVDRVEFGLVAHKGAAPLPIAKSASGGELSRVMLALEVVLAEPDSGGVMVFDEVDAGVGGAAAVQIGARLARLARRHQVIVVTHLPQVAAFADNHLVIGKSGGGDRGRQTSTLTTLDRDERVAELARMLAGLGDSETGRAHAEELLSTAEQARTEA